MVLLTDLAAAMSVIVLGWLYLETDFEGFLTLVVVTLALALLVGVLVRAAPEPGLSRSATGGTQQVALAKGESC